MKELNCKLSLKQSIDKKSGKTFDNLYVTLENGLVFQIDYKFYNVSIDSFVKCLLKEGK